MAGPQAVAILVVAYLTTSAIAYWPASIFDTDRPVHLAVLTLACSSILLFLAQRSQSGTRTEKDRRGAYASIPLQEVGAAQPSYVEEKWTLSGQALNKTGLVCILVLATLALTVRIEVERRLLLVSECVTGSLQIWLPFLVAVYDALRFQPRLQPEQRDDDLDASAYQHATQSLKSAVLSSPWRYVPSAFLLSLGCHLVVGLWSSSQSSQICPLLSPDSLHVPQLRWTALLLDTFLIIAAYELATNSTQFGESMLSAPTSWMIVTTITTALWAVISTYVYHTQPENLPWLLVEPIPTRSNTVISLISRALFLSLSIVSSLYSMAIFGLLFMSMVLTTIAIVIPGIQFIWSAIRPYPSISSLHLTWSFILVYFSWSIYIRTLKSISSTERSSSTLRRLVIYVTFFILLFPGLMKSNTVHFHPVDLLMYDAYNKHARYLDYAGPSKTLSDAVRLYQERYQDNPPPGFDKWFEFAKNRSVFVVDEFNQIYNDLLPFRAISPADLRQHTWDMVSNPWNEISGITIRNGKALVQENVLPTHRWMLEGVAQFIAAFSEHLPDMDLGFNLNDESRVAVPYLDLQTLQNTALGRGFRGTSTFSANRNEGWQDIPQEPPTDTVFENWSFQNTFKEWAARTCPSDSAAQKNLAPLYKSELCLDCLVPHSLGQFLSNWSVAANPCHQPDLANLHGFYLSPAAFKSTHLLRPVFSQSKVGGFNDILYPSAWNYMDKVVYAPTDTATDDRPAFPDPKFLEKESTLFWRGATSEGVSDGHGAWRGMTRQRMVHLANNLTSSHHDVVTLLLPDQKHPDRFTYTSLPGSSLSNLGLSTDANFVNEIVRCGGKDCDEQSTEFALVKPEDFQTHWKYKYLIDLDGAGFSGRFLPFLQSRSLPFKAALFREWYDSRLVPWLHFVPLDLRLHGLWSTLAYFSGVNGIDSSGKKREWKAHDREGEIIAEAGREWSRKVLRKEDMEVYFFRLLLEWGRLTDDNRDELGFTIR